MEEVDRPILVDKLCSGDKISVLAIGMAVAHSVRLTGSAAIAVDALGRVCIVDTKTLNIQAPRVQDTDLDLMTEDESISVMLKEGREERELLEYLIKRDTRKSDAQI